VAASFETPLRAAPRFENTEQSSVAKKCGFEKFIDMSPEFQGGPGIEKRIRKTHSRI
jgi:hypothetical protein